MASSQPKPRVFIISGAAASGKTTYAKKLQKEIGFQILDLDDPLRDIIEKNKGRLEEIGMENFLSEIRDFRYMDLQQRGIQTLKKGKSVALVAPFSRHIHEKQLWDDFCAPFIELGMEPELHWVKASNEVRADRLSRRGAYRDSEKVATPEQLANFLKSVDIAPPIHRHTVVDN